jgi:DNA-binding XRE family transcriptional regulator
VRVTHHVTRADQSPGQGRHAPRREPEPPAQLARREAASHHEVLERGQLRLLEPELARSGRALVVTGQVEAVQEQPELVAPVGSPVMSYWLCTHWPTSSRMPRVSPEEQFARNLRRLRHAAGLSQEQLADRTGLHPTEISRLERAAREPRLGTIIRLASGLGVRIEKLVADIR